MTKSNELAEPLRHRKIRSSQSVRSFLDSIGTFKLLMIVPLNFIQKYIHIQQAESS